MVSYSPTACSRAQSLLGLTHTSFNLLDISCLWSSANPTMGMVVVVISPRNRLLVCAPSVTSSQACPRAPLIMNYGRYVIGYCSNFLSCFLTLSGLQLSGLSAMRVLWHCLEEPDYCQMWTLCYCRRSSASQWSARVC